MTKNGTHEEFLTLTRSLQYGGLHLESRVSAPFLEELRSQKQDRPTALQQRRDFHLWGLDRQFQLFPGSFRHDHLGRDLHQYLPEPYRSGGGFVSVAGRYVAISFSEALFLLERSTGEVQGPPQN